VTYAVRLWLAAIAAAFASRLLYTAAPRMAPLLAGAIVLPLFALLFLAGTRLLGIGFAGRKQWGSGIRDQGSGIGDRGSGIRDQGSGDQELGIEDS
jgi:hypothetical protein